MTPEQREQWRRADQLLEELLDLDEQARRVRLAGLDEPVRSKVERMLAADSDPRPAVEPDRDWVLRTAATGQAASLSGRKVGGWILDEAVGQGGMATVYRCHRDTREFEQSGALKLLRMGLLTEDGRRRFNQEKKILASLQYRHIAGLLDAGTADDGTPYIVMEYVEGLAIDRWVSEHQPDQRAVVEMMIKVCDAVAFAQQNLVVHRDIKPSNIIVDQHAEPVLLDFGIARLVAEEDATGTTTRAYTPGFAAPEQISGGAVTTATDVFGLGATLFRLLTGQSAIEDGPADTVRRMRPMPGSLDRDFSNVLRQALHEEPERRYRDAAALAEDLAAWQQGRPVRATPDSLAYRLRRYIGRHRWGVAAAVLLAITATAGIAATLWQARQAQLQAEAALAESARAAAVGEFLTEIFEASAAGRIQNELPTTGELLDIGATRAREEFAGQPALKAEMLSVVGGILGTQGRYAQAEVLLGEALQVQRSAGLDPAQIANTLMLLARARSRSGKAVEAIPLAREALELLEPMEQAGLSIHDYVSDVLVGALLETGDQASALSVAQANYDLVRRMAADDAAVMARSAHTLGLVYSSMDQFKRGHELMTEAWNLAEPLEGQLELKTSTINALAISSGRMGRTTEQLQGMQRVLELHRRSYPPGHPRIGRTLNNLSSVFADLGMLEQAAAASREALEILESAEGAPRMSIAAAYNNLASLLTDLGRNEEALEAYSVAEQIVAEELGQKDWRRGLLLSNKADSLIELGRFDDALEVLRESAEISEPGSRSHASSLSLQAKALLRAGRYGDVAAPASQAVEIYKGLYPEGNSLTAMVLGRMGLAAFRGGDLDNASDFFAQAQQQMAMGQYDRAARYFVQARTEFLSAAGRPEEAAALLRSDIEAASQVEGTEQQVVEFQGLLEKLGAVGTDQG